MLAICYPLRRLEFYGVFVDRYGVAGWAIKKGSAEARSGIGITVATIPSFNGDIAAHVSPGAAVF
jgi:hypothetical protein